MPQSNPSPRRARRATTQTIEEIEARAAAILQAEHDVLRDLAAWLRAAAVELPPESRLPLRLAKAAKHADLFTTDHCTPEGGLWDVERVLRDWERDEMGRWYDEVGRWLGRSGGV